MVMLKYRNNKMNSTWVQRYREGCLYVPCDEPVSKKRRTSAEVKVTWGATEMPGAGPRKQRGEGVNLKKGGWRWRRNG